MIRDRLTRPINDRFRKRINRVPSPVLARGVPWLTIALASILPGWPFITSAPVIPPFGFMLFIAWRQVRPGLMPVWAGIPLGLCDDMFSGQPFGSAILLWSVATLVLEFIEFRFPWRLFSLDWLVASGLIGLYLLLSLTFANAAGGATSVLAILPQAGLAMLVYPLLGRLVALFDRLRLVPFMEMNP